jgi:amino acid adenylation domain-containing protein
LSLTQEIMREDIAGVAGRAPRDVGDEDDLIELGLDSIAVMRLSVRWRRLGADIRQAELLELSTLAQWWALVRTRLGAAPELPEPVDVDPFAPFALSRMQHAYWMGRQAGGLATGAHVVFEFDGSVDPTRLERAVRRLVDHHPMLRCRISDGVNQILPPSPDHPSIVSDLRPLSERARRDELARIREAFTHRSPPVERGIGLEVRLSLLPGDATRLHLNVDMLIADAASFRLLVHQLAFLHADPELRLPRPGLDYATYRALRAASKPRRLKRAERYWQRRLAGLPGAPDLPWTRPLVAPGPVRVRRLDHRLTPSAWQELRRACGDNGVTPAMFFCGAFAEVLGAWSATPRFCLNLPLFDREPLHEDVELLVGDFTNTLLLEVSAEGADFLERVRGLQAQLRRDMAHSAVSGVEVIRSLGRLREGPVHQPVVFTSALGLGDLFGPLTRPELGRLVWMASQTPQVALDVQIAELDGGVLLNWDAVDSLFPAGVLDAMFSAWLELIAAADRPWTELAVRVPPRQLAARTAHEQQARPGAATLHDAVRAQASRTPEAVAVLSDSSSLSYRELVDQAERLAGALQERGVRVGGAVGIRLDPGLDVAVAVLGTLMAGACWVPFGRHEPVERLIRRATAAQVDVVIGDGLPGQPGLAAAAVGRFDPPTGLCPTAYILFTSGSSGAPKGVAVSHRAALNTLAALVERAALCDRDRTLALSPLDFDLSVFDLLAPLLVGGAVVCVPADRQRDVAWWGEAVQRFGVTVWQTAPPLLDMLLRGARPDTLGGLRLALVGGDRVPTTLGERFSRITGGSLVALGGATEAAIHSTWYPWRAGERWEAMPYGVPLRGVRLRVVDEAGADRPDFVPGEILIGGASVAEGYVGRPDLTASRFLSARGTRWYRTGDRGRFLAGGILEFLGRIDSMIKLRGHRIEPGEIEAVLEEHAGQAVVLRVELPTPRLVAYLRDCSVDSDTLREALARRLPEFMHPRQFVRLDAFPLTHNGKIDGGRLRLDTPEPGGERSGGPPQGPREEAVGLVWCRLLGVSSVQRDDSFFRLGGDSLLGLDMVEQLRGEGWALRPAALFAHPRLRELARSLREAVAPRPPVEHDPAGRFAPFDLTHTQRAYLVGRNAAFTLGGCGSWWYWSFESASLDIARLEAALNRLIARHDMLRVVIEDGRQRVLEQVPTFRIRTAEGDPSSLDDLSHRLTDTARWPLFAVRAVVHPGGTRVGFGFDFIALDALSIATLFAELARLYVDPDLTLPPIDIGFRDLLLARRPSEQARADAWTFWNERAPHLPPAPALPLAVAPATIREPRFVRREHRLDAEVWSAVQRNARSHGLTASSTVAAAYGCVLSTWSGGTALTLNYTLFDRPSIHPHVRRVLGDFTGLMLVPFVGRGDFADTARGLQSEVGAGLAHREVDALELLRRLARDAGRQAGSMPVVFTSTLGVDGDLVRLDQPFGRYAGGVSQTPQVWLDCQVVPDSGGLLVCWDAVDALFPEGLLDAMFSAFTTLLRSLTHPDVWSRRPVLLPAEQDARRQRVNATDFAEEPSTLHERFFEAAGVRPEATALLWGGAESMSYGDLSDAALRVAGWLQRRGVVPGEAVAVRLHRGPQQVVAVLGILAAGAAYVPVSPEQPSIRAARMLESAGVRVVIDDLGNALETSPLDGPVPSDVRRRAYIIFTSGSTGRPKGVEISHQAAMNTISAVNRRLALGPTDRLLALSELDFDLSVYDLFGPLSVGGAVVLLEPCERREATVWAERLLQHGVTVWNSVPTLLEMLLAARRQAPALDRLRAVLVSGDWVPAGLPARLARVAPRAEFFALGGATEASIWSNIFPGSGASPDWSHLPYGHPLSNQRFRVVGEDGGDCPDHVAGELWIGGAGTALGYVGDSELTGSRFVEFDGLRWYRTGDMGCYWPDGTLQFLGRVDSRVKVRGHRLELAEVEGALRASGAAQAGCVVEQGGVVAFVVGGDLQPALLEGYLQPHARPKRTIFLDALPLTSNGKVDRGRLGELARLAVAAEPQETRSALEEEVCALLEAVLDRPVSRVTRSLFELGVDSLVATVLGERLWTRFGVDLRLQDIYREPTVRGLAAQLAARVPTLASGHEEGAL